MSGLAAVISAASPNTIQTTSSKDSLDFHGSDTPALEAKSYVADQVRPQPSIRLVVNRKDFR